MVPPPTKFKFRWQTSELRTHGHDQFSHHDDKHAHHVNRMGNETVLREPGNARITVFLQVWLRQESPREGRFFRGCGP